MVEIHVLTAALARATGAVGVLVHAALSGAPLAREYAARCLTNLATCDSHRMELLKEGAATVLVALIKSYSSSRGRGGAGGITGSCCYVAARALQNMAKSRAARRQLQVRTLYGNSSSRYLSLSSSLSLSLSLSRMEIIMLLVG